MIEMAIWIHTCTAPASTSQHDVPFSYQIPLAGFAAKRWTKSPDFDQHFSRNSQLATRKSKLSTRNSRLSSDGLAVKPVFHFSNPHPPAFHNAGGFFLCFFLSNLI
ncbi:MAG: hypothetical protein ACR2HF_16340 [Methylococcaceae bacterium]